MFIISCLFLLSSSYLFITPFIVPRLLGRTYFTLIKEFLVLIHVSKVKKRVHDKAKLIKSTVTEKEMG